jgi:hypothetical protein
MNKIHTFVALILVFGLIADPAYAVLPAEAVPNGGLSLPLISKVWDGIQSPMLWTPAFAGVTAGAFTAQALAERLGSVAELRPRDFASQWNGMTAAIQRTGRPPVGVLDYRFSAAGQGSSLLDTAASQYSQPFDPTDTARTNRLIGNWHKARLVAGWAVSIASLLYAIHSPHNADRALLPAFHTIFGMGLKKFQIEAAKPYPGDFRTETRVHSTPDGERYAITSLARSKGKDARPTAFLALLPTKDGRRYKLIQACLRSVYNILDWPAALKNIIFKKKVNVRRRAEFVELRDYKGVERYAEAMTSQFVPVQAAPGPNPSNFKEYPGNSIMFDFIDASEGSVRQIHRSLVASGVSVSHQTVSNWTKAIPALRRRLAKIRKKMEQARPPVIRPLPMARDRPPAWYPGDVAMQALIIQYNANIYQMAMELSLEGKRVTESSLRNWLKSSTFQELVARERSTHPFSPKSEKVNPSAKTPTEAQLTRLVKQCSGNTWDIAVELTRELRQQWGIRLYVFSPEVTAYLNRSPKTRKLAERLRRQKKGINAPEESDEDTASATVTVTRRRKYPGDPLMLSLIDASGGNIRAARRALVALGVSVTYETVYKWLGTIPVLTQRLKKLREEQELAHKRMLEQRYSQDDDLHQPHREDDEVPAVSGVSEHLEEVVWTFIKGPLTEKRIEAAVKWLRSRRQKVDDQKISVILHVQVSYLRTFRGLYERYGIQVAECIRPPDTLANLEIIQAAQLIREAACSVTDSNVFKFLGARRSYLWIKNNVGRIARLIAGDPMGGRPEELESRGPAPRPQQAVNTDPIWGVEFVPFSSEAERRERNQRLSQLDHEFSDFDPAKSVRLLNEVKNVFILHEADLFKRTGIELPPAAGIRPLVMQPLVMGAFLRHLEGSEEEPPNRLYAPLWEAVADLTNEQRDVLQQELQTLRHTYRRSLEWFLFHSFPNAARLILVREQSAEISDETPELELNRPSLWFLHSGSAHDFNVKGKGIYCEVPLSAIEAMDSREESAVFRDRVVLWVQEGRYPIHFHESREKVYTGHIETRVVQAISEVDDALWEGKDPSEIATLFKILRECLGEPLLQPKRSPWLRARLILRRTDCDRELREGSLTKD